MGKNLTISHFSFFLLPLLIPLSSPAVRSPVSGNILSASLARKLCTVAWENSRYCWFACDVTTAMFVVKNKSISLLWKLNSIFMEILWEKSLLYWPSTWPPCHVVANQEFRDTTTTFPAKWCLRNGRRNSILVTCHYPGQGSASDWPPLPIGSLSNGDGDGDGKENGEKAIGLDRQNNKPACVSRFLVLSNLPSIVARLPRETSTVSSFTMEDVNARQRFSLSFSELRYSSLEWTPEEFPSIKKLVWNGTRVRKFETARTRFLRARLHGAGGPRVGEVTRFGGVSRLSI